MRGKAFCQRDFPTFRTRAAFCDRPSVMELVFELEHDPAGVVKVRSSEGVRFVELIAVIGDIGGCQLYPPALTELLADGKIEGSVAGEVRRAVALEESRAVED